MEEEEGRRPGTESSSGSSVPLGDRITNREEDQGAMYENVVGEEGRRPRGPAPPGERESSAGSTVVIVNPSAGSGVDVERLRSDLQFLWDLSIHVTTKAAEGREVARTSVAGGAALIVAVGGDGTLHEVIEGIAPHFDRTSLAVLPTGTGNDTARSLGIPLRVEDAIERLRRPLTRLVDVMEVEHDRVRSFALNVITAGLGGAVNEALPEETKERWGGLAYARAAATVVTDPPVQTLSVAVDDGPERTARAVSLVVANGRFAAGGVCVAPGADIDDGHLDVHVILDSPVADLLALVPAMLRCEVPDRENYLRWRCERVSVCASEAGERIVASMDGEAIEAEQVRCEIRPSALRVIGAGAA